MQHTNAAPMEPNIWNIDAADATRVELSLLPARQSVLQPNLVSEVQNNCVCPLQRKYVSMSVFWVSHWCIWI